MFNVFLLLLYFSNFKRTLSYLSPLQRTFWGAQATTTATATATKTSLKKWIRAGSNSMAHIPSRLIRQMLPNFSGVEFLRTVSKCRKRKRKLLSCVPVLDKTWNEALSCCSRAVTNKPIAFLLLSLPSVPSLCRREAGEKEKRNKKARGAWWEGKRDSARFLFFFLFFVLFFYWYTQRSLCEGERRHMVWKLGAWGVRRPLSSPTLSEF